jgi:hypothetical protein
MEQDFENSALNALKNMRNSSLPEELANKMNTEEQEFSQESQNQNQAPENQFQQGQGQGEQNQESQANEQAQETQETQENQGGNSNENTDDGTIEIESPLFGGKIKLGAETNQEEQPEGVESINEYLKKNFEIEDITSLSTFVETAKKNEAVLSETKEKLDNAEKLFQMMNPVLYEAVVADLKGEDWTSVVSTKQIDYRKSADDLKQEELVEAYFPGQLSKEDWEEYQDEDGDPKVKKMVDLLIKQSKQTFEAKKQEKEKSAAEMIKQQEKARKQVEKSLNGSISFVEQKFAGIDKGYLNGVVEKVQKEGIASLFYNQDGTFKEDAILRFVMADQGFELVQKQQRALELKIETRKNQEILTRGANAPGVQSGKNNQQQAQISEEVQKQLEQIRSLRKGSTYDVK